MDSEEQQVATPPPVQLATPPPVQDAPKPKWAQKLGPLGGLLMVILAKLKSFAGIFFALFKYAKLSKVLLTSGSMLLSIVAYSTFFGWKFALGFVVGIFVHEMGHVFCAWTQGVPVSAPLFIPFMGALITKSQEAKSTFGEAIIAIGGPIFGALCGCAYLGYGLAFDNGFFDALGYVTLFMNLFNLAPMYPLDGGRILGAVSPYLWIAGVVIMIALFVSGVARNPMIIILVLMGLPRIWMGLKTGNTNVPGQLPATPTQKLWVGLAYSSLCLFLFVSSSFAHRQSQESFQKIKRAPKSQPI